MYVYNGWNTNWALHKYLKFNVFLTDRAVKKNLYVSGQTKNMVSIYNNLATKTNLSDKSWREIVAWEFLQLLEASLGPHSTAVSKYAVFKQKYREIGTQREDLSQHDRLCFLVDVVKFQYAQALSNVLQNLHDYISLSFADKELGDGWKTVQQAGVVSNRIGQAQRSQIGEEAVFGRPSLATQNQFFQAKSGRLGHAAQIFVVTRAIQSENVVQSTDHLQVGQELQAKEQAVLLQLSSLSITPETKLSQVD